VSKLILGAASSHAFAVTDPSLWDENRERNRQGYARRYGKLPPEQPRLAEETDAYVQERYARIHGALEQVRRRLEALKPDVLVFVADDQNENFTEENLPQVSIFAGEKLVMGRKGAEGIAYPTAPSVAESILETSIASDIDMAVSRSFPEDRLFAHAFGPVLRVIDPEARIPVVPIFVNAIHMPAPSPARCHFLGQTIRKALETDGRHLRAAMYGSGGLSHFTQGYPWAHYQGQHTWGSIVVDFDRWLIERMQSGKGSELARLSTRDLLDNGEIELRSWITVLGAIGDRQPELLVYEPFYRAIMGMGVGCWMTDN
jgi:hypothetical protein